jgi:hypothetical protein
MKMTEMKHRLGVVCTGKNLKRKTRKSTPKPSRKSSTESEGTEPLLCAVQGTLKGMRL